MKQHSLQYVGMKPKGFTLIELLVVIAIIAILAAILLIIALASCESASSLPEKPDGFSFTLTWGCYGISSYDSESGKLVKTKHATYPENYVTTYNLSTEEYNKIYSMIRELNIEAYPDVYNPHKDGIASAPSMTLILSVKTNTVKKTVTAENIALTYECNNADGRRFLNVCKNIQDILIETDQWKALPEYEFFYD